MRFKKLRVFTGIALVVFFLIVGNIVAFGLVKKNSDPSKGGDDSKNVAPVYQNKYSLSDDDFEQKSTTTTTTATPTPMPSPTVNVVHTTVRTRAS